MFSTPPIRADTAFDWEWCGVAVSNLVASFGTGRTADDALPLPWPLFVRVPRPGRLSGRNSRCIMPRGRHSVKWDTQFSDSG